MDKGMLNSYFNTDRSLLWGSIVISLMLLLTSCSGHIKRGDGPPDFYVDETKIPDAIPKREPLSKLGNMESYRVFGKRYHVIQKRKRYEAVGIASWYGTQFHKKRTSSGELYDMLGMTAAHKTLPLPTYVEVTNLKNNKKVIVKVNDRGPFESNRILDLSYVAAKKLGMLGKGTAQVKIKSIDFDLPQPIVLAKNKKRHLTQKLMAQNQSHSVYLQVGAFRSKNHALQLQKRLFTLLGTEVSVSNKSKINDLYRVQIGPIRDLARENEIKTRLNHIGIRANKGYGA